MKASEEFHSDLLEMVNDEAGFREETQSINSDEDFDHNVNSYGSPVSSDKNKKYSKKYHNTTRTTVN